jgi:hypothetical protein
MHQHTSSCRVWYNANADSSGSLETDGQRGAGMKIRLIHPLDLHELMANLDIDVITLLHSPITVEQRLKNDTPEWRRAGTAVQINDVIYVQTARVDQITDEYR